MRLCTITNYSLARTNAENMDVFVGSPHCTMINNPHSSAPLRARQKAKTEMCTIMLREKFCRFGDKCKYAHHIDELSQQTLRERSESGLIDLMTFRTRPCIDHVMTGSW
jgi:hypothetical protein